MKTRVRNAYCRPEEMEVSRLCLIHPQHVFYITLHIVIHFTNFNLNQSVRCVEKSSSVTVQIGISFFHVRKLSWKRRDFTG